MHIVIHLPRTTSTCSSGMVQQSERFRQGFCSISLKTLSVRFEFHKFSKVVLLCGDGVVNYHKNHTDSTSVVHSVRPSVTVIESPASAANTETTEDEGTEDFLKKKSFFCKRPTSNAG